MHRLLKAHLVVTAGLLGAIAEIANASHISGQSQIGGWVYIDRNNDGVLAFATDPDPEYAIGDVDISLFSIVGNVETLVSTTQTSEFGRYLFENIDPGMYTLRQTQPVEFVDGLDTLGVLFGLHGQAVLGGASAGTLSDNAFVDIVLTADVGGEFYNFGERGLAPGYVSKRLLLATAPDLETLPPPPPPPPPTQEGNPDVPESTSLAMALIVIYASAFAWCPSRRRQRQAQP